MQARINPTISQKLSAFLRVSRANLLVTSIGHATLGLFLAATSIADLLSVKAFSFIILHYIIALFGCNVNSYSDYEVDKLYKKYMSDGVKTLGKSVLRIIIVLEAVIALILILFFFFNGFILVAILALIGFMGALFYSLEPIRIKKHGLASPIPVIILYTFPLLGGWFIFKQELGVIFVLFVFGYMFMNQGFTLVNTCEDYTEDKEKDITTWAHVFGLQKTLTIAFVFCLLGLLCVISLVLFLLDQRIDLFYYLAFVSIIVSSVLILKASFEVHLVSVGQDLERNAKQYATRLQRWFMMTRYPLMVSAILLLL